VSEFAGLDLPALGSSAAREPPLLAADGEICRPGEQPAVPTASAVDRIPAVATGG
jgi:hypothetical protein